MERFKACEKEMKTKAYSKEGLTNSGRLDPREKEKVETSNFISSMLEELERQIESLEAEQETIQATMKKGRKDSAKLDRISNIEHSLDRHGWHQGKLEIILRMLENGNIAPDSVNSIQDDIEYYIESNQDLDFAEDEEIYDSLNLVEEEDGEADSYDRDDTPNQPLEDLASDNIGVHKDPSYMPQTNINLAVSQKNETSSTNLSGTSLPNLLRKDSTRISINSPMVNSGNLNPATSLSTSSPVKQSTELKYASAAASGISALTTQGNSFSVPSSGRLQSINQPVSQLHDASSVLPIHSPSMFRTSVILMDTAKQEPSNSSVNSPSKDKIKVQNAAESEPKVTSKLEDLEEKFRYSKENLPSGLKDLINSFDAARRRIGTPPPLESISKVLDSSYSNRPDSFLANKPMYYQPQSQFPSPNYYPQEPLTSLNDSLMFQKMDLDTLFYIFYYRQGTYQQSLAAKELKNRSWRFHKRFLTWFQRHEEPKTIKNDFEEGVYRYFDFEGLWLQRRKSNFKFEYEFLEDELSD